MTPKEELIVILQGIRTVRARWLRTVRRKATEIRAHSPGLTPAQAFNNALTHTDSFVEFTKLMNLFGLIGSNSTLYLEALIDMPEARVVPIRKRAS